MFEFAIALPILLVIFAGAWEMARGLWTYEILNKGVRDASRYLARVDDPTSALSEQMALRLVLSGDIDLDQPPRLDFNDVTIVVGTRTYANTSGQIYRSPNGGTEPIDVVQVRANMTYEAPLLGFLNIASPIEFSVAHEQRYIGD
ncbi:MAG: pilus assembly protein [Alphaproteobacteria bacterium]|nr:pilus assembly protein [Alphaproteobacteria bacterium]